MNVPDVTDVSNLEQVARYLLEANANIEAKDNEGWTAIMSCAQNGHTDVCAYRLMIAFIINLINENSGRYRRYK